MAGRPLDLDDYQWLRSRFSWWGVLLLAVLLSACANQPMTTLKDLEQVRIEIQAEQPIERELADIISYYRTIVEYGPDDEFRARAMKRLADLRLAFAELKELDADSRLAAQDIPDFRRALAQYRLLLDSYPDFEENDSALYRMALAHSKLGEQDQSIKLLETLVHRYPGTRFQADAYFRIGEYYFDQENFSLAETAYRHLSHGSPWHQFYQSSLYKLGWSLMKLERHDESLELFLTLLDFNLLHEAGGVPTQEFDHSNDLAGDTLRAMALILSDEGGVSRLETLTNTRDAKPYDYRIYQTLATHYQSLGLFQDAAGVLQRYAIRFAGSTEAALFKNRVIELLEQGGFKDEALLHKQHFVRVYGPNTPFWLAYDSHSKSQLLPVTGGYLRQLTRYYHTLAQQDKRPIDFRLAEKFYRTYLVIFPQSEQAETMQFMLAQLLYQKENFAEAAEVYEQVAHSEQSNERKSEAAYASMLSFREQFNKSTDADEKNKWKQKLNESILYYSQNYPTDKRLSSLLATFAFENLEQGDFTQAKSLAQLVLDVGDSITKPIQLSAWSVKGHASYELGLFSKAEQAYEAALRYTEKNEQVMELYEWRAASIYMQGGLAVKNGNLEDAVAQFMRVTKLAPNANIRPQAQFDAGVALIKLNQFAQAIRTFESLRELYPQHELRNEIAVNLADSYKAQREPVKAAKVYSQLALGDAPLAMRQDASWEAAILYRDARMPDFSAQMYETFIKATDTVSEDVIEARYQLAKLYRSMGKHHRSEYWLNQVVAASEMASEATTDRTLKLAAEAALQLAETRYVEFNEVKLEEPLKQNLEDKKFRMERAVSAYNLAAKYRVGDVLTQSNHRIGQMYHQFSTALMESERPPALAGLALEQYNLMLEDEAAPFEDKAIEILERNTDHTKIGLYTTGIKDSYDTLKKLMPMRYNKAEQGDKVIESLH